MSKTEQEARIEQVRGNLSAFQNPGAEEAADSCKRHPCYLIASTNPICRSYEGSSK